MKKIAYKLKFDEIQWDNLIKTIQDEVRAVTHVPQPFPGMYSIIRRLIQINDRRKIIDQLQHDKKRKGRSASYVFDTQIQHQQNKIEKLVLGINDTLAWAKLSQ